MYIAVDIGGTKTLIAAFDESGDIIKKDKFPTDQNYDQFLTMLVSKINDISTSDKIEAVAIAVPGHVEDDSGVVEGFGNLNWSHVDIHKDIEPKIDAPIYVDNDANMGAVGEANSGAGVGKRKVLYVTISTGIGTGVTIDGKLDPALRESEGGNVIVGSDENHQTWEEAASGKSFYKKYGKQGKDIDDPEIWKEYANSAAEGFWDIIALIQPDIIVIGGSMGVHFKKYGQFLNQAVDDFKSDVVDHPPIVQAKFPDDAVINGCYEVAKHHANRS